VASRNLDKETLFEFCDDLIAHAEATVESQTPITDSIMKAIESEMRMPSRAEIAMAVFLECTKRTLEKITSNTNEEDLKKAVGSTVRFSVYSASELLAELSKGRQ